MRGIVFRSVLGCFLLPLTLAAGVLGADGAIPVWEPREILKPGLYRLTRNIFGPIQVRTDHVELDLNGFTVEAEVDLHEAPIFVAPGVRDVYIHDGTVINTANHSPQPALSAQDAFEVRVERATVMGGNGWGLHLVGEQMTVRNSSCSGHTGIVLLGTSAIAENNVVNGGILVASDGSIIRNNAAHGGIEIQSDGNFVAENTVGFGEIAIHSYGGGNYIVSNTVSGFGYGITVDGGFNRIENNVLIGNEGIGLFFTSAAADNVYLGNVSRDNASSYVCRGGGTADFCDEGIDNVSHGGNYLPDLQ